ncbi:hypothetical protein TcBrA4_0007140 [Trypanosoma cruzi]|nr:hypothetical protein TcBrA4_0007140 [Trypanosoma cruzi]
MAQPNSQMACSTSLVGFPLNAVDCGGASTLYPPSGCTMRYDEWLQETLLQETPDVVNRYGNVTTRSWDGVQHII